jgi:hypothetical protein
MKPLPWPDWMDHLLAKSKRYGGETLAGHTWDVLCRLADLYRLRPHLADDTPDSGTVCIGPHFCTISARRRRAFNVGCVAVRNGRTATKCSRWRLLTRLPTT